MPKITPEVVKEIISGVSKQIIVEQSKKDKAERDWRLRNTKLLMKNYHILKEHCSEVEQELEEYGDSVFDPYDDEIESIMLSKAKTRRMVWYIDEMVCAYERYAYQAGESPKRRYTVLVDYYIKKKSFECIALEMMVSDRTIRRDLDDAIKEFSIFLFGLLAIKDLEQW